MTFAEQQFRTIVAYALRQGVDPKKMSDILAEEVVKKQDKERAA